MLPRLVRVLALVALVLLGSFSPILAQDAAVTGIVTDSSNAVVAGASLNLRNTGTGIARSIQSSQEGNFTVTNLRPGSYELTAELDGFRTYKRTGIVLEVGQKMFLDVRLEVGSVAESVVVTAQAPAVNSENGAIQGDVIVQQEIQDLPLDGRNFTDLAMLVPGVMPSAEGDQGSDLAVGGARADSTNFVVDGFNTRDPRSGDANIAPNIGAMQEFKMEVAGYSAEYGRMGGGIVNMVLRSGTNNYHGDVFEYVRNNVMDARAFFDQEKLKLNRHQFGATFHGPVRIPKLYNGRDRTFFMFSWESYRQIIGVTTITHVPSQLERSGNFSQSLLQTGQPVRLTDPLTRGPFPGNIIPTSRIDPIAAKLMSYYYLPNRADARNNFLTAENSEAQWDSFVTKLDHRFNDKNSVAWRYQNRGSHSLSPFGGSAGGNFGQESRDTRSLMGLDYIHLFTPAFLVEFHSGYSRSKVGVDSNDVWRGRDIAGELGIPGTTREPDLVGWPLFSITDYAPLGTSNNLPSQNAITEIQNSAKFTWVKSRHNMKWGIDDSHMRYNAPYVTQLRGQFTFNGAWSTAPLSDFLLGMMSSSARLQNVNRNYLRSTSRGGFFNDDFKLLPNLTINLGIRYEVDLTPYDRYDHLSMFVPSIGKIVTASKESPEMAALVAKGGVQSLFAYASDVGLPRSLIRPDYNNVAPRFGFAWSPWKDRKTVVRGGYGIFYTGALLNPFQIRFAASFPFSVQENYTRNASRPDLVTLSNPFPTELNRLGGTTSTFGTDVESRTGYLQSYNLTFERDLSRGMAIEIGYSGSKGTHLGKLRDVNYPRRSEQQYRAGTALQNLRPYPFWNNAINVFTWVSNSNYNSGQVSLRKRGRNGTFYRISYSFSKSIDDASQLNAPSTGGLLGTNQDPTNWRLDRGRSDWDRGHVVTASYSWMLPIGKGRKILGSAKGLEQAVIGGWQLAGTSFFATGAPLTVNTLGGDANLGDSGKPNRIGRGIPADIAGQRRGVDYPWFVLSDFVAVPSCVSVTVGCPADKYGFKPFVYGNSGRSILDGPGRAYSNLSLMKNFGVRERKNFQLRFEAFNVFNQPNFNMPNKNFNSTGGGLITSVAGTGRGGSRVFQAALKFAF